MDSHEEQKPSIDEMASQSNLAELQSWPATEPSSSMAPPAAPQEDIVSMWPPQPASPAIPVSSLLTATPHGTKRARLEEKEERKEPSFVAINSKPRSPSADTTIEKGASHAISKAGELGGIGRPRTENTERDTDTSGNIKFEELPVPRKMCIRCSKQLAKEPALRCVRQSTYQKCKNCNRSHCLPVPAALRPKLENLQRAAREQCVRPSEKQKQLVVELQKSYTSETDAFLKSPLGKRFAATLFSNTSDMAEMNRRLASMDRKLWLLANMLAEQFGHPIPEEAEEEMLHGGEIES